MSCDLHVVCPTVEHPIDALHVPQYVAINMDRLPQVWWAWSTIWVPW